MEKRRKKTERTNRALDLSTHETLELAEPVSLEVAMADFIKAKKAERSAPRTIRDYETHFRYLLTWLSVNHPKIRITEITPNVLREYVSWMSEEKERFGDHPIRRQKRGIMGLSPMTVNVRIRTMRAFFNWCEREGLMSKSPASDIKLQKTEEDRISAFTEDQVFKLLAATDRNSFNGFRDYVIMTFLLDTGLRISELLSLTVRNINFEQLLLTVPWEKAKTRKTRTVPFSKSIAKNLAALIKENEDFGSGSIRLFYSSYGRPLSPDAFDERLKIYGEQAGISGVRCSAHTFRHTFALLWIKRGGDPFSLQKMLGHTDMSMVRRYVRLSESDVKELHQQFSPLKSLRLN